MDIRSRFERFAAKVGETASQARTTARAPALEAGYWRSVRDLFTRDVTRTELHRLVAHEGPEAFRYFTHEVDFDSLAGRPWYERYSVGAWRAFQALAYRLNPARRVLFAAAGSVLLLSWIAHFAGALSSLENGTALLPIHSLRQWLLLTATALFFLLALELRDKLTLKGDLEIARQIQFGLLPFEPVQHGSVAIRAAMRPANTVGGDYFDLVDLELGRLALIVGDVSGKGMPAALLMALLQGSLRTLASADLRGAALITKLNAHLCANIPPNRLITLFYGELDADCTRLRYVNAGHNPPLLVRASGTIERLAPTGMALGVLTEAEFEVGQVLLEPGDRLLLYTDGITEANDATDAEYGETRLEAYLQSARLVAEDALLEGLLADVLSFCGPIRPRDDMTLMIVARREPPVAADGSNPRT